MMNLAEMEAQGLKRFKVGVISARADMVTIYAKSGEDAVKLVMEGDPEQFGERQGRPAGFEAPIEITAIAREMHEGVPDVPFLELFMGVLQQGAPKGPPPKVQVPKLVMP
jgi:hypothetical protein